MKLYKRLLLILFMLLAAAGISGIGYLYIKYRSSQDKETLRSIQQTLSATADAYQNRAVTLTIDGRPHSYTMAQLGERIYYQDARHTTYDLLLPMLFSVQDIL